MGFDNFFKLKIVVDIRMGFSVLIVNTALSHSILVFIFAVRRITMRRIIVITHVG